MRPRPEHADAGGAKQSRIRRLEARGLPAVRGITHPSEIAKPRAMLDPEDHEEDDVLTSRNADVRTIAVSAVEGKATYGGSFFVKPLIKGDEMTFLEIH